MPRPAFRSDIWHRVLRMSATPKRHCITETHKFSEFVTQFINPEQRRPYLIPNEVGDG